MHPRVFISSHGDAGDERIFAQQVVEQELPRDAPLRDGLRARARESKSSAF